jgi:ABC-type sugar transport system ATPase subunit
MSLTRNFWCRRPIGCSKTTTLRLLAGLGEISDSKILLDRVVNDVAPKTALLVFQPTRCIRIFRL